MQLRPLLSVALIALLLLPTPGLTTPRQRIDALYIPLADHYAAIIAYENYSAKMQFADFHLHKMTNWDLLRAHFQANEADMAFIMSPLALDMFRQKPTFRWIGLMHRDGNALAVNHLLSDKLNLLPDRQSRKPNGQLAELLRQQYKEQSRPVLVGVPHILSTHSVVLYSYLKQYGLSLSLMTKRPTEIMAIPIPPPTAPTFLKNAHNRSQPAAFEQSLPWADVVETEGYGKVVWYSKNIIPWPQGHVECIAVASDQALDTKFDAVAEVMTAIHVAGQDIEQARMKGGAKLNRIITQIRKHIPEHSREAILASLDQHLRVINYDNLYIDLNGLQLIMDLALEGGILKQPIELKHFQDPRFAQPGATTLKP